MTHRCPFCHETFASVAAVISHVEGQICISARHHYRSNKIQIETHLLRIELELDHKRHQESVSLRT